jgi:predicted nucleic acid-binding protein
MIVYADASALVKRYVMEPGSDETIALTTSADAVATAIVSRAEVAAAFARAVRTRILAEDGGRRAQRRFSREWPDLVRIALTEPVVERAEALAWLYQLRGDDAVQLAAAHTWRDALGRDVVMATFDRRLWEAASQAGLEVWPKELPSGTASA